MYLVFIYYAYVYNVLHFILNKSINQKILVSSPQSVPVARSLAMYRDPFAGPIGSIAE